MLNIFIPLSLVALFLGNEYRIARKEWKTRLKKNEAFPKAGRERLNKLLDFKQEKFN